MQIIIIVIYVCVCLYDSFSTTPLKGIENTTHTNISYLFFSGNLFIKTLKLSMIALK